MLKYIGKGWMKSLILCNPGGGATRLIFEWGVRLGIGTITVTQCGHDNDQICEKYTPSHDNNCEKDTPICKKNAKKMPSPTHDNL